MLSPSCGTLVMNCLLWLFDMAISLACQMSFLLSLFSAFWLVFFCFLTHPFLKLMPMGRHKALPLPYLNSCDISQLTSRDAADSHSYAPRCSLCCLSGDRIALPCHYRAISVDMDSYLGERLDRGCLRDSLHDGTCLCRIKGGSVSWAY